MRMNPQHYTVRELLAGRVFRIPEYQRAYSWGKKQRDDLFQDLRNVVSSGQEHFLATVVGMRTSTKEIGADQFAEIEIVDGQQRITTLVILLRTIVDSLDEQVNSESKQKSELINLLVKNDDYSLLLLQTNHDSTDVFSHYLRSGQRPKFEPSTQAEQNIVDAIKETRNFLTEFPDSEDRIRLISALKNKFSVLFHEINDESIVYKVFEVLNSRGLEVRWIDKLKSQLMALIYEHSEQGSKAEALREMRGVWSRIYHEIGLRPAVGNEALRHAGTLVSRSKESRLLKEEDAVVELIAMAGTDLKSILNTANWLYECIKGLSDLDSNSRLTAVLRISQARFLANAIGLSDIAPEFKKEALSAWEKSTFKIYGIAARDARSSVGEYVRLACRMYKSPRNVSKHLKALENLSDGYELEKYKHISWWENSYDGWQEELRYLLFRYEEYSCNQYGGSISEDVWTKIWNSPVSKTIEHIKPQSASVSYVHELGNLTLLPPKLNSRLGKKPPVDKADDYIRTGIRITSEVGSEIKKLGSWKKGNVRRRTEEIFSFMEREWG